MAVNSWPGDLALRGDSGSAAVQAPRARPEQMNPPGCHAPLSRRESGASSDHRVMGFAQSKLRGYWIARFRGR